MLTPPALLKPCPREKLKDELDGNDTPALSLEKEKVILSEDQVLDVELETGQLPLIVTSRENPIGSLKVTEIH